MGSSPGSLGFAGGLHRRIWDEDGIPFRAIRGSFEKVRGEQSRSSHRQLSLSRLGYGMDDTHQSGQMREKPIRESELNLRELAQRFGIRVILQFGSTVTGTTHESSDVDLAVAARYSSRVVGDRSGDAGRFAVTVSWA